MRATPTLEERFGPRTMLTAFAALVVLRAPWLFVAPRFFAEEGVVYFRYARTGRDSLAVAAEERLLARANTKDRDDLVSGAVLDIAHARFNQKRYREAAAAYEDFLHRWPAHKQRTLALYQAGVAYLRLDRAGDAVDRWETLVRDSAGCAIAEKAWARLLALYGKALA